MASIEDNSHLANDSSHSVSENTVQKSDADVQLPPGELPVECPVCLQPCVYPVKLPCSHVFCFLCVKGVAGRNRRCALCRAEFPQEFVRRPVLLAKDEVTAPAVAAADQQDSSIERKFHWYYEGVGGWWEYDERTSIEIEKYRNDRERNRDSIPGAFELLIAGFIYIIDLENSIQYRRGNPRRRRRIKRDLAGIPDCKGVAGLACRNKLSERRDGDGTEAAAAVATGQATQSSTNALPNSNPPTAHLGASAGAAGSSRASLSAERDQSGRRPTDVTERLAALDLSAGDLQHRRNGQRGDLQDSVHSRDRHQRSD